MHRNRMFLTVALLVLGITNAKAQSLINFDFAGDNTANFSGFYDQFNLNGGTGAVLGSASSRWNYVTGFPSFTANLNNLALFDDAGAATSVRITGAPVFSLPSSAIGTYSALGSVCPSIGSITISGLIPNNLYDFVLYSARSTVFNTNGSSFQTIEGTSDWSSLTDGVNYRRVQVNATAEGDIVVVSPNWSSFQIQAMSAAPEPPSSVLLTIGIITILGMALKRRSF